MSLRTTLGSATSSSAAMASHTVAQVAFRGTFTVTAALSPSAGKYFREQHKQRIGDGNNGTVKQGRLSYVSSTNVQQAGFTHFWTTYVRRRFGGVNDYCFLRRFVVSPPGTRCGVFDGRRDDLSSKSSDRWRALISLELVLEGTHMPKVRYRGVRWGWTFAVADGR